ncbi:DHA2 family efflux MFS transporter permease subunit [Actinoplanes sp. NPDC023801]|uniref:DHA2 family efflux MFS transporter permease subunit n=1 Tax=Actinoplanes sp. NPDC023801 TaxID=3154595 RepID=UPI0033C17177
MSRASRLARAEPDPGRSPLDPRVRAIGLALAIGGLMVVIDTTVTAVAVPAIVSGLDATLAGAQWATAGYLLGLVAVIPLAGRLSERYGARRVYLVALAVFTVFSALAGLAWDVTSLAVFRVLQGLGGGLLNPVGQAIGLRAAPRDARGRVMSLLVLPLIIGPLIGPVLAGWLIDTASWRWIFLLNIPIGVLAVLICARVLPHDRGLRDAGVPGAASGTRRGMDWAGLVLLSGGAVLVVLGATAMDRPADPGPMDSGSGAEPGGFTVAVGVIAAGLGMLAGFVWRARRIDDPVVDLRLLRHRQVRAGAGVLVCFAAAYFGSMSVLPLFVQGVRGDPASFVGLLGLPQAITVGIVAQVATRLVDRIPARRIVLTGTAVGTAGGVALLAATVTDAGYPWIAAASVLLSAGSGATLMPTMTIALRDLDHTETPRGTTLLGLATQLSNAVAGAVVAVTISALVSLRMPEPGGGVAGMLDLDPAARAALRPDLAVAVGAVYLLPVVLLAASCVIACRSLRPPQRQRSSGEPRPLGEPRPPGEPRSSGRTG